MLCCFKLPSHLYQGLLLWEEGRKMLFLGHYCFCPSYNPGHSVRTVAWLFHLTTALNGASVSTELHLWQPSLSLPSHPQPASPTHFDLPTFSCTNLWIIQVCLCWAGDPLLSHSLPTCKFKWKKKVVFSFLCDADVRHGPLSFRS